MVQIDTFDNPPPDDTPPKAKTPPRTAKKEGAKPRAGRPVGSTNKSAVKGIEETLNDALGMAAMAVMASGNFEGAAIIGARGPKLAAAWAELARVNPNVRRVLEKMMKGGAWGSVVISTASIALPLAQTYNVLPQGVPNPFALTPEEFEQAQNMRTMFGAAGNPETNGHAAAV